AQPLASNSAARNGPKAPVAPVRNTFSVMSSNPLSDSGPKSYQSDQDCLVSLNQGLQSRDKGVQTTFARRIIEVTGLSAHSDAHFVSRRGRAKRQRQQRAGWGDADVF